MAENFERSRERENIATAWHDRQHLDAVDEEVYRARLDSQCRLPPEVRYAAENFQLPELTITDPGSQRRPADFDDRIHSARLQQVRDQLASEIVEQRGSGSGDHVRAVRESLAQYPTETLLRFVREGGRIEAAGQQFESSIIGRTTNFGHYLDHTHRAEISEYMRPQTGEPFQRNPEVRQTVGHEFGHALDRHGAIASSARFQTALRADVANLSPADRAALAARRDLADSREVFAEIFSVVSNQNSQSMVRRNTPGQPTTDALERRRDLNDQMLRWFPRTAALIQREFAPNR